MGTEGARRCTRSQNYPETGAGVGVGKGMEPVQPMEQEEEVRSSMIRPGWADGGWGEGP